ncbi:mxaC protein [Novimethylophilus kurashikiensis]|uniref:MxaC protein n=1 Tax=Novimethylophilus kurashikiensis TaxID=1825523 RepID=A0A2R5F6E4_9PROT|nr:vWA domain-containing protein [Novimethylophilus kurashikiensis]GBG13846.1 mxaC protein [Novimethylophilus kurashikiensis]
MTLAHPWALVLLPAAFVPFWLKTHQGQMYSWLAVMPKDPFSDWVNLAVKAATALLLGCIVLALAAPQGPDQSVHKVGKGAQTVFVVDRSVSMDQPFAGTAGHAAEIKSAAARRLITKFIDSRPDDMMGVVAFTNSALYGVKITSNRNAIHSAINAATSAGINQTNIGAGLTEAAGLFDAIESTGSRAIILLSDGAGKLSPRVKKKVREALVTKGLSLYWIVLREPNDISIFNKDNHFDEGSEPPAIELDNFFKSIKVKYHAYEADNPLALQTAIQDIDSREKNLIQYTVTMPGRDYSKGLIMLALALGIVILIVKNLRVHSWETA